MSIPYSPNTRKQRQSKQFQSQLLKIPIVQKLHDTKNPHIYRKFIHSCHPQTLLKGRVIRSNNLQVTKMLLLIEGKIMVQRKKNEVQKQVIEGPGFLIMDRSVECVTVENHKKDNRKSIDRGIDTMEFGIDSTIVKDEKSIQTQEHYQMYESCSICEISEKEMYYFFESLIQFPQLSQKLSELRQTPHFAQKSQKELIRLAIELQESIFIIGSKIYNQGDHFKQIYILVAGSVLLERKKRLLSILSKGAVFGDTYEQSIDDQGMPIRRYMEAARVVSQRAVVYKVSHLIGDSDMDARKANDKERFNGKVKWREARFLNARCLQAEPKSMKKFGFHRDKPILQPSRRCDTIQSQSVTQPVRKSMLKTQPTFFHSSPNKTVYKPFQKPFGKPHTVVFQQNLFIPMLTAPSSPTQSMLLPFQPTSQSFFSQEQIYGKRLQWLKKLRKKKYGQVRRHQRIVFFPMQGKEINNRNVVRNNNLSTNREELQRRRLKTISPVSMKEYKESQDKRGWDVKRDGGFFKNK